MVYGVTTGFGDLASVSIAAGRCRAAPGKPADEPCGRRRVRRSRARSCGRCCSCARTRWPSATAAAGRSSSTACSTSCASGSTRSCPNRAASARPATSPRWPTSRCRSSGADRPSSTAPSCPALIALREAGLEPLELEAKEGLALLNGTQMMSAIGALLLADADRLARTASVAAAMSVEALLGTDVAFAAAYQLARPHPGQVAVAARAAPPPPGQRAPAAPPRPLAQGPGPVLAAVRPAGPRGGPRRPRPSPPGARHRAQLGDRQPARLRGWRRGRPRHDRDGRRPGHQRRQLPWRARRARPRLREAGRSPSSARSASDGPRSSSMRGSTAACRRSSPRRSGVDSGMMIYQYTAAALASENKVLAHPASVDSIPTSANQEDHVSMGSVAARHARTVLEHVERIVAIELLVAAQALELRLAVGSDEPARGSDAAGLTGAADRGRRSARADPRSGSPPRRATANPVRTSRTPCPRPRRRARRPRRVPWLIRRRP